VSGVEQLAVLLLARGWMLATAESCTGGLIAAACTDLAGSSAWFDRGFVTYSYPSKTELLDVPQQFLAQHGAVSETVARAMVLGAVRHSQARVAVAVTGIAGPSGATADKPVGTVWFAYAVDGAVNSECVHFGGDRAAVRAATVRHAIDGLVSRLRDQAP
jgi:nicotinamide-nucleotide amidase